MLGRHGKHGGDEPRSIPIKDKKAEGHEPEEAAPEMEEASAEAAPETLNDEHAVPAGELEKARAEAHEANDKYLRLYAETENYKKRMAREWVDRERFCNEGLIRELLPVTDNLERALAHADETGGTEGLVEGVKMVHKQLSDALGKFGVKPVECVGLPFDPASQQAMTQVETDEHDEGTVVQEFQKGYFLHERILRPAMVVVAKRPSGEESE